MLVELQMFPLARVCPPMQQSIWSPPGTLLPDGRPDPPRMWDPGDILGPHVGQAETLPPVGTCSCRDLALRTLVLCPYG